jgi:hypothetical protein
VLCRKTEKSRSLNSQKLRFSMSAHDKKVLFSNSEVGIETRAALEQLQRDIAYNTVAAYHANEILYPDNLIPFVEKHMQYLSAHPAVNPTYYLANLRLMTKIHAAAA